MNIQNTTLPLFVLLASMLIVTMMRVAVPVGQRVEGKALSHVTLNYRERVLLQRTNIYAIGTVLLITSIGGLMPMLVQLAVIAATFVIVSVPVRYTFTTEGIALNKVVFRKWSEFSGCELRGSRMRLIGHKGHSSFTVSLMAARRPGTVQLVERLVKVQESVRPKRPVQTRNGGRTARGAAQR